MKKKRTFTREFKLSVLEDLQTKKPAEICREHNLHPSLIGKWKNEFQSNPKKAFSGYGNLCKYEAELERYKRLVGELYAQIDLLRKAKKKMEEIRAEEKLRAYLK